MITRYWTILVICLLASPAWATTPCMLPTSDWFNEHIIQASDAVIYARVRDFSDDNGADRAKQWTKVEVIQSLFSDKHVAEGITILGWQAYLSPLYAHKKGDYLVLWLKKSGRDFTITDLSWQYCVPSVWGAKDDKTAFDVLTRKWISIKDLQQKIQLVKK